jgi:hypothetical protein
MSTRRAETTCSAEGGLEILRTTSMKQGMKDIDITYIDLNNARCLNFLYHELSYAIPFFD